MINYQVLFRKLVCLWPIKPNLAYTALQLENSKNSEIIRRTIITHAVKESGGRRQKTAVDNGPSKEVLATKEGSIRYSAYLKSKKISKAMEAYLKSTKDKGMLIF